MLIGEGLQLNGLCLCTRDSTTAANARPECVDVYKGGAVKDAPDARTGSKLGCVVDDDRLRLLR